MSAYGHQMEREFSAQSLSSGEGGSDMRSRYTMETGIYMSSFAATVFIAGLITVGVSLLMLLIALVVMLQSCENRNSGVVEYKHTDNYHYCQNFALYAELNYLGADSFPAICKDAAILYVKKGQYMKDLNATVSIFEDFFASTKPIESGQEIVLMDADDFVPSENLFIDPSIHWIKKDAFLDNDCSRHTAYLKRMSVTKLCLNIQADGWQLVLLSRKPEKLHSATAESIMSVGCGGWASLMMRGDDELQIDSTELFSRHRTTLQEKGFRIVAMISSQMDAVRSPSLGERVFKLPNPLFSCRTENYISKEQI